VLGSFRDPAGFVFQHRGGIHRLVRPGFAEHYDRLMGSGLYAAAVERGLLVAHEEVDARDVGGPAEAEPAHRVLRPEPVPFISYPYEWCFSQLRDAALLTLDLARLACERGLVLKDASAYNVQFWGSSPVLIDTLSFEIALDGAPWPAYYQFCKHFLAPLAVASKADGELGRELRVHLDGLPLRAASRALPLRSWVSPGLLSHIHLHAATERASVARRVGRLSPRSGRVSRNGFLGLLEHLERLVRSLDPPRVKTAWGDYERSTHYSPEAAAHKTEIVSAAIEEIEPTSVWDLGANTGRYSRIASGLGIPTLALDADVEAVERNYLRCRAERDGKLQPLRMDLTNPSPAIGWRCEERMSLAQRGPCDLALALALVHHLVLGEGIPLEEVARGLRTYAQALVVEWVPPTDACAAPLLARRPQAETSYTETRFQTALANEFEIVRQWKLRDSERALYLLRVKR